LVDLEKEDVLLLDCFTFAAKPLESNARGVPEAKVLAL
jgi:hypothetical protein